MERFVVKFGNRIKRVDVHLEEGISIRQRLEDAIRLKMMDDPFMKENATKGFFLTQHDPKTGMDVEIDDSTFQCEVDINLPIMLMIQEPTNVEIPVRIAPNPATMQVRPVPLPISTYLDRLGVSVHNGPSKSNKELNVGPPPPAAIVDNIPSANPSTSSSQQKSHDNSRPSRLLTNPQDSNRKRGRKTSPDSEEDSDNDYIELVKKNTADNRARLAQVIPIMAPKLRPATGNRKKKDKENVPPTRIMPRRAAKQRTVDQEVLEDTDDSDTLAEDARNTGPLSTHKPRQVVQIKEVGHFHLKKNHRLIGNVITKFTPLPEFPKKLKESLEEGIFDPQLMNSFLKTHVESVTKDSRISKTEYGILSEQVVSRFKAMNLVNPEGYMMKVRKGLSDSLRASRYYKTRKANRRAASAKKRMELTLTLDGEANAAERAPVATDELDEADVILQRPVVKKNSVKMCISASTTRIPFMKTHSVEEVIVKYPYLKEADLLIYEYSMRVPLPLNCLHDNFSAIILPLSHILNETLPEEDDEQGKIMLFHGIENHFCGEEQHLPSLQFCNGANRHAAPLNDIPKGQAPAIIVASDGTKSLQSATLIFDGNILTTLRSPSAFESIALLMAGYWVYHIDYPAPYWQHMECIEAILHGKITEKASKVLRFPKMQEFLTKLIVATEVSTNN